MTVDGLHLIAIDDPADPRVREYVDLKSDAELDRLAGGDGSGPPESPRRGLFVAEGEWVVRCLIESPYRVRSVLATPQRVETMAAALAALPSATPIYIAAKRVIQAAVGFPMHRGILALGERAAIPPPDEVIRRSRTLVLLEDLSNQDNVGGAFRNAAAFGGAQAGILLSPSCCDPLYRKAVRVSMGHALRVPFSVLEDWPAGLAAVRHAGFSLIALTPDPGATPIDQVPPIARPALLVGSEGYGLSQAALLAADLRVRIPMAAGVDSLNASVASAIALHRLCPFP